MIFFKKNVHSFTTLSHLGVLNLCVSSGLVQFFLAVCSVISCDYMIASGKGNVHFNMLYSEQFTENMQYIPHVGTVISAPTQGITLSSYPISKTPSPKQTVFHVQSEGVLHCKDNTILCFKMSGLVSVMSAGYFLLCLLFLQFPQESR